MKERIFEGNLSGLGAGVAKMQTGEAPTIELVADQVPGTRPFRPPCPPYLCLPTNPPVKDTGQR